MKCAGQGLSADGHYKASSRALVGEEEVLEVKGKIRNNFFPFFPHIYLLIKKKNILLIDKKYGA